MGIVRSHPDKDGYRILALCKEGRPRGGIRVHNLVASAFIRPPLEGEEVNHKNDVRDDNRPENLEWLTRSDHKRQQYRQGLLKVPGLHGENHPGAKLGSKQVAAIRYSYLDWVRATAKEHQVTEELVRKIADRRLWKELSP